MIVGRQGIRTPTPGTRHPGARPDRLRCNTQGADYRAAGRNPKYANLCHSGNPQLLKAERNLAPLQDQLNKMGAGGDTVGEQFLVPQRKVPKESMEYIRGLRDVKYYQTIFDILARQYEAAKLDEAREGELAQVVDPALVPDRKSSPSRLLWTMVALLLGLAVATSLVFTRATLEWMRRDPETGPKMIAVRQVWFGRGGDRAA